MKKYIIGLNIGHDAAAVLLEDGAVLSAVSEERLSRIKNHAGFPYKSLGYLVNKYHIGNDNLEGLSVANESFPPHFVTDMLFDPGYAGECLFWRVPDRYAAAYHISTIKRFFLGKYFNRACSGYYNGKLKEALKGFGLDPRITYFDHHLCHAASSFYSAGKDDIILITADGSGDGLSASVNIGDPKGIRRVYSTSSIHSPGRYYSALTAYLGFKVANHEGKITGLAAYGDASRYYDKVKRLLGLDSSKGSFRTEPAANGFLWGKIRSMYHAFKDNRFYDFNFEAYNRFFKKEAGDASPEDLSAAMQKRLEDVVVEHVEAMTDKFKIFNVGLAGGLFANVKLNQRIAEIKGIESLFIHPNMGDGGLAFGAAYLLLDGLSKDGVRKKKIEDVYWGPQYTDKEIDSSLKKYEGLVKIEKPDDIEKRIALLVESDKIIALFHGRMEYGPRALGNRSLLADPRKKDINDILNKRLKRTEFMPFAPSVLEEKAGDIMSGYGKFSYAAEFMTITFDVRPDWIAKIPAVVHVDGTARPQVVKKEASPRFYKILKEYEKLTGIPALINTSFNMHESPIVCSPDDALDDYMQGAADFLVLGDYIVERVR